MKTKNKLNFSRFRCFLNGIFPGLWVNFLVLLSHVPYKKSEELPLACLYLKFHLIVVIHTYFCTKGYVKRFVRVLVLSVINTGCPKKIAKNGEHCIVDFQFKLC